MVEVGDVNLSLAEYRRAFEQYGGCVSSVGATIIDIDVDPRTGQFTWGVDFPDSVGVEVLDKCYEDYFAEADARFANENSVVLQDQEEEQLAIFAQMVAPCLDSNEVEYLPPQSTQSPEWRELNMLFAQFVADGRCPGIEKSQ